MIRNIKYWSNMAKFFAGELKENKKNHFLANAANNQELKTDLELMKKTWEISEKAVSPDTFNSKTAWVKLNKRLHEDGIVHNNLRHEKKFNLPYSLRIAALIIVLLAVGIPAIYLSVREISSSASIEKGSDSGQNIFELPDGSRVYLNEGAKLRYEKTYLNNREVTLKGEGYFEIMSDPAKPFHVNAGKVVVTVMGTSFNVKETDNQIIEIFVESGTVKVTHTESEKSIILEEGEFIQANDNFVQLTPNDLNYLSWKTKEFHFIDEPLSEIIEILENAYHVQVKTTNVPASEMRLTTTYKDQTFDAILNTICKAFNIQYQIEGKVYILQIK